MNILTAPTIYIPSIHPSIYRYTYTYIYTDLPLDKKGYELHFGFSWFTYTSFQPPLDFEDPYEVIIPLYTLRRPPSLVHLASLALTSNFRDFHTYRLNRLRHPPVLP